MAADAEHGPDSDNYFKANDPAESYDVETRVKTLNFLSRTRSPSAQKEQDRQESKEKAKKEKSEKSKPEPKAEEEAHVLGAWLLDEKVLELLKIHSQKKGNTGHTTEPAGSIDKSSGQGHFQDDASRIGYDAEDNYNSDSSCKYSRSDDLECENREDAHLSLRADMEWA